MYFRFPLLGCIELDLKLGLWVGMQRVVIGKRVCDIILMIDLSDVVE